MTSFTVTQLAEACCLRLFQFETEYNIPIEFYLGLI